LLIAERFAEQHGWPHDLAEHYLIDVLRYQVGPMELEAMARFGRLAFELGLIDAPRELNLYAEANQP
jgi:predicted solute-binding protein